MRRRLGNTLCTTGSLLLVLLTASCDSDPGSPIDGSVFTLDVVPATAWLASGSTLQLDAIPRDSTGAVADRPVTWSTSNAAVVSVSSSGLAHAVAAGTATILAEAGGVRSTTVITVTGVAAPVNWSIEQEGLTDASLLGSWADASSQFAVAVGQTGVIMESTGADWHLVNTNTEEFVRPKRSPSGRFSRPAIRDANGSG